MVNIAKYIAPKDDKGNDPNDFRDDPSYLEKLKIISPSPAIGQPFDLFNTFKTPAFPVDLLPEVIARYATDQSELIGVDPAIIGMAAIATAAAAIDDRIEIQPKRYDPTWREQPRLWVALIGDPSAKKSPGLAKAIGPLRKIDHEWRETNQRGLDEWEQECELLGKNDKKPPPPEEHRLMIGDITVEKVGDILSRMPPRGIMVYNDEITSWLSGMDAYKNSGNKDRSSWLESYNGGPKSFDRIIRGSTFVQNWSACVLGGIQPSVVQAYAKSTNHDGMLQRFILIQAGAATAGIDRHPDMKAKDDYEKTLRFLAGLDGPFDNVVKLSEEAHLIREPLDVRILKACKNMPNKFLSAALGKWSGLFARLLLVFHCIENATTDINSIYKPVTGETAERVSTLMWQVLLPHAIKFYEGLDPAEDLSRDLASLILAHQWERFSVKRDLNRYMRASRKLKPWEIEEMLDRLYAFNWITPEKGKINERGKPSAYKVNSEVHKQFTQQAEAEKLRRQAVSDTLQELKVDV